MHETHSIQGFRNGDEHAFADCFNLYFQRLRFFAQSLLKQVPGAAAADIVQDAFEKLWQRHADFEEAAQVRAFLYTTVKNTCLDLQKHHKVIKRYQPAAVTEEDLLQHLVRAEVLGEVHQALRRLPEGCRSILQLGYFQGLKNQEIARRMHISVNTVKSQKVRALKLLRNLFPEQLITIAWIILQARFPS